MPEAVRIIELATLDVTVEPARPRAQLKFWAVGSIVWSDVSLAATRQDTPPAGSVRIPTSFRGLPQTNLDYKFEGGTLWTITVNYGFRPPAGGPLGSPTLPPPPPGVSTPSAPAEPAGTDALGREWEFDTAGETVVKRVSEFTRHKCGVNPPDFKKAIQVGPNGVEGCEVPRRKFNFRITRTVPGVTMDYFRTVYALTGTVNNAPFLGFDGDTDGESELLFLGGQGRGKDNGEWTVTWTFMASPNRSEELISGDGVRAIGGHDFIWYVFGEGVSVSGSAFTVMTPKWAYVERVFKPGDFTLLGIFS